MSRAYVWTIRTLYTTLIAANLWLAFDWWRGTPEGAATLARWKARAENCQGCARRRARLAQAFNRLHWETLSDAEEIVSQADSDSEPGQPGGNP